MEAKGYELIKSVPDGYTFDKPREIHTALSEAYEEMWTKIYPYFKFDRSHIEQYYTRYNIDSHLRVLRKVIWCDFTPNKSIHEVVGYMNSISAYQCYLEDNGIAKGSDEDPHIIMRRKFSKIADQAGVSNIDDLKIDFITPYYAFMTGKKVE